LSHLPIRCQYGRLGEYSRERPDCKVRRAMAEDFGVIAWHEDGRWNLSQLEETRDMGYLIDQMKNQQTNGGAIALIAFEEEFFIVARCLGTNMQLMISDVTYAPDYEVAAELVEILGLPFPEDDDESQPGGDIDLLADLGLPGMELEALCDDAELFPDEQIDAIAARLGFGEGFAELYDLS
jgi:putative tRNA adenosine deaminase-associated protein